MTEQEEYRKDDYRPLTVADKTPVIMDLHRNKRLRTDLIARIVRLNEGVVKAVIRSQESEKRS